MKNSYLRLGQLLCFTAALSTQAAFAQQAAEDIQRQIDEAQEALRENGPEILEAFDGFVDSRDAPPAFRRNWLIAADELRSTLRDCVTRLRIAERLTFTPTAQGFVLEIEITNATEFAFSGITFNAFGDQAEELWLDRDNDIEFEPLEPGATIHYSMEFTDRGRLFLEPQAFEVSVVDVLNEDGIGLIFDLFGRRHSGISSIDELDFALKSLCWMP